MRQKTAGVSRLWCRHWPLFVAAFFFTAIVCIAAAQAVSRTDGHLIYSLDDAYIHMAMAKNLARHGVWGVTPYHFASASSSILWTALLALVYGLTGVNTWAPLLLNWLFCLCTLAAVQRFSLQYGASSWMRLLILVGVVTAAGMPSFVLMGMEHSLHLWLTVWFAGAAVKELTAAAGVAGRRPRAWLLPLLGALLAASRYEGLFLAGTVCLLFACRRRWLRGITVGIAALLPMIAIGVVSLRAGGFFLPNPLMLKAAGPSLSLFRALFKPIGAADWNALRHNPVLLYFAVLGLLLVAANCLRRKTLWHYAVLLPLFLTVMILLHLHYGFSYTFWVYRYTAYLEAFGLFAAAAALTAGNAAGQPQRFKALLATAAAGLILAGCIVVSADFPEGIYPGSEIASARDNYLEHVAAAIFIHQYYGRDAVVFNDIGAVCFYTAADVLDMFGLGSMEPMRCRLRRAAYEKEDVFAWTRERGGRIAVLQLNWSEITFRIPGQWQKVAHMVVPGSNKVMGFFAVDLASASDLRRQVKRFAGEWAEPRGIKIRFPNS